MSSVGNRPIADKLDHLYLPVVIIYPVTSALPSDKCRNSCQLLEKRPKLNLPTPSPKIPAELIPIVRPYHTEPIGVVEQLEPLKSPSSPSNSDFDHWATEQSSLSRKSPSLLHWDSTPPSPAASSLFASEQKLDISPPAPTYPDGSVFTVLSSEPLVPSQSIRTVDIVSDTNAAKTTSASSFVFTNPIAINNMKLDEGFDDMLVALPPSEDLPVVYSSGSSKQCRSTTYQKVSKRRSSQCRNLRETICQKYILLSALVALITVVITAVVTWKLTAATYAIPYEEAKSIVVDMSVFYLESNPVAPLRVVRFDPVESYQLEAIEDGRRNLCRQGSDHCAKSLQAKLLTTAQCRRPWQGEKWKLEAMLTTQLNKSDLCGFYQCKEIRICCHEAASADMALAKVIFKVELGMSRYQLDRVIQDSGKIALQMAFMTASATLSEMYEKAIYNTNAKRVSKTEVCVHQLNFLGTQSPNACMPQSVCIQEFSTPLSTGSRK